MNRDEGRLPDTSDVVVISEPSNGTPPSATDDRNKNKNYSQSNKYGLQNAPTAAAATQPEPDDIRISVQSHNVGNNDSNNNNNETRIRASRINENKPQKSRWDLLVHWYCGAKHEWQRLRKAVGKCVNNPYVESFIVFLIAVNGIMLGIATYSFVRDNPKVNTAFETTDLVFLIIFTVELALQTIYHGWRVFLDGWLTFDFLIVMVSWSFASVQIVRAFRIFRVLRLTTRIKVMRNLVLALFAVIPRLFAIGMMLFLVSYIFAVMFTLLFKDLYEEGSTDYNYFGRIDDTFFTLFQLMTLDNWADVARQVMAVYSWAWLPFITFVIITGFVVVNLIIAVICDAVAMLEDEDRAKLHGSFDSRHVEEFEHPALQQDVQVQLDTLETYVDELASLQEQTLRSLHILTQQLSEYKNQQTFVMENGHLANRKDCSLMLAKEPRAECKKSQSFVEEEEEIVFVSPTEDADPVVSPMEFRREVTDSKD